MFNKSERAAKIQLVTGDRATYVAGKITYVICVRTEVCDTFIYW